MFDSDLVFFTIKTLKYDISQKLVRYIQRLKNSKVH